MFAFPFQYVVSMHRLVPGLWEAFSKHLVKG